MWGKSRALRGIICNRAAVFCKKYKVSHNSHFMYTIMLVGENVLAYPHTILHLHQEHHSYGWCFLREKGGIHLTDIQKQINKVLLALRMKGIVYKVNTKQFYSKRDKRFITMYIVWETNEFEDGEKFYSKVKMLLWLVERYKEVNGSDSGSGQGESE